MENLRDLRIQLNRSMISNFSMNGMNNSSLLSQIGEAKKDGEQLTSPPQNPLDCPGKDEKDDDFAFDRERLFTLMKTISLDYMESISNKSKKQRIMQITQKVWNIVNKLKSLRALATVRRRGISYNKLMKKFDPI